MIRDGRVAKKMTQGDLGERLGGVAIATVSEWELEDHPPKIEYIPDIIVACGLSPESFLMKLGIQLTPIPQVRLWPELLRMLLILEERSPDFIRATLTDLVRPLVAAGPLPLKTSPESRRRTSRANRASDAPPDRASPERRR